MEIANHPWAASLKDTHRSFVCSQKTGRKGADATRRNLHSINYKTADINRQQGKSTNTNC